MFLFYKPRDCHIIVFYSVSVLTYILSIFVRSEAVVATATLRLAVLKEQETKDVILNLQMRYN